VPGGGLAAHEAAGGHAPARHVGLGDADLIARVGSSPGISGASSFSSRAVAEATTADLLAANSSQVSTWLGSSGGKLVLSGPAGGNVRRYVAQGSTTVIDATGSTVVLVRDASTGVGYRIQTAFPTP
jgi:filamentous hemagglutinin